MAKQKTPHKYIFKINSSRLRAAKWDLTVTLSEAKANGEIIALNDSQMLRWIDELNGMPDAAAEDMRIRKEIGEIKQQPSSRLNRRRIQQLYGQLDEIRFRKDYMHLVIDRDSDMLTACRGFKVNGTRFVRLLGTNGGVKCSTIVFVNEQLVDELRRRIDNGRANKPQIPAKLEAYRALTCSGTIPVSMPNGILVVPDCETTFKEDIIMLNDEGVDEPVMEYQDGVEITLDESDGYGLICPALAERWSAEVGLDYVASGMVCRNSWEKGTVFTFDFHDFADKVAGGKYLVKDAWGHEVDIRNVELILTTSMLKLWDCYDSIEHYLSCCEENHYTFGITKTCPKELERRRTTNYQFIQSYNLTDEQVDELIKPTIDELRGILSGDYRKALLFMRGTQLDDESVERCDMDFANALMVEPRMYNDPYVRKRIYAMIEKKINDAKIGVLSLHANYSIVCGDPYALCQSIFELPVTGLLKAGQIYNKYWIDAGAPYVACFRAPMSCHNNVLRMEVANTEEMAYWYRYMKTCTMFNAWDTSASALNGMDKDGDLCFLTDNSVLVNNIRPTRTIFCVQRKGQKVEVTEELLVKANLASFGDDIGKTTNYITSMYDVQAQYEPGSVEYETLAYRIQSGQLFQQNCIDKVKGIVCKPMPKWWFDYRSANTLPEHATGEDITKRDLNLRMLADRKPYFMRYIYPKILHQYNKYIRDTDIRCYREFCMSVSDLLAIQVSDRTERQAEFIRYYQDRMPVSNNNCVMNRICRRFEREFDGKAKMRSITETLDPNMLKCGTEYSDRKFFDVMKIYRHHAERLADYLGDMSFNREGDRESRAEVRQVMLETFREECLQICSSEQELCDIVVDMCYKRESTKQFAWDVCGDVIVSNLLRKHDGVFSYPILDPDGDIEYCGETFSMIRKESDVWLKSY